MLQLCYIIEHCLCTCFKSGVVEQNRRQHVESQTFVIKKRSAQCLQARFLLLLCFCLNKNESNTETLAHLRHNKLAQQSTSELTSYTDAFLVFETALHMDVIMVCYRSNIILHHRA